MMKAKDIHNELRAGQRINYVAAKNGRIVTARRVDGRTRLECKAAQPGTPISKPEAQSATRVVWRSGASTVIEDDTQP